MRYTEPKERSAELLRLTLGHMGRHVAAFNPVTFTVWYEYAAGGNGRLSSALDRLLGESRPVDDETVLRLYKDFIAPADDDTMERISGAMQRLMTGLASTASQTGTHAGVFGAELSGLAAALAAQDVAQLSPQLSAMVARTAEMKNSVDTLQSRVSEGQEEIQRLRRDLDRARDEALLDPLTGILNRKGFDRKLQSLLSEPTADGVGHGMVMLDIDHFKKVNDTHGHLMGDRVIQAVGEILRSTVTHPTHAAARYGGEEFAILLPQTSLEQCARVAEDVRLRTKAMKIRNRGTQEVVLTISISGGVAAMRPGDDASAFISRADAALYESKKLGRDRVTRA